MSFLNKTECFPGEQSTSIHARTCCDRDLGGIAFHEIRRVGGDRTVIFGAGLKTGEGSLSFGRLRLDARFFATLIPIARRSRHFIPENTKCTLRNGISIHFWRWQLWEETEVRSCASGCRIEGLKSTQVSIDSVEGSPIRLAANRTWLMSKLRS